MATPTLVAVLGRGSPFHPTLSLAASVPSAPPYTVWLAVTFSPQPPTPDTPGVPCWWLALSRETEQSAEAETDPSATGTDTVEAAALLCWAVPCRFLRCDAADGDIRVRLAKQSMEALLLPALRKARGELYRRPLAAVPGRGDGDEDGDREEAGRRHEANNAPPAITGAAGAGRMKATGVCRTQPAAKRQGVPAGSGVAPAASKVVDVVDVDDADTSSSSSSSSSPASSSSSSSSSASSDSDTGLRRPAAKKPRFSPGRRGAPGDRRRGTDLSSDPLLVALEGNAPSPRQQLRARSRASSEVPFRDLPKHEQWNVTHGLPGGGAAPFGWRGLPICLVHRFVSSHAVAWFGKRTSSFHVTLSARDAKFLGETAGEGARVRRGLFMAEYDEKLELFQPWRGYVRPTVDFKPMDRAEYFPSSRNVSSTSRGPLFIELKLTTGGQHCLVELEHLLETPTGQPHLSLRFVVIVLASVPALHQSASVLDLCRAASLPQTAYRRHKTGAANELTGTAAASASSSSKAAQPQVETLSFMDPRTKALIQYPGRGVDCMHLAVVDLEWQLVRAPSFSALGGWGAYSDAALCPHCNCSGLRSGFALDVEVYRLLKSTLPNLSCEVDAEKWPSVKAVQRKRDSNETSAIEIGDSD